ncbi:50S ribosomal protein L23 [Candidatus Micrarchaeota archaeon]|nr:50S ribosomal protein L23 [Candidatus Micrarchaeota archaeon]
MIIIAPIKTEKAITKIEKENTLTFLVASDATQDVIAKEIEKLFAVKVQGVRTLINPNGKKQAFVRLTKEFKADDVAIKLKMIA